MGHQDRICKLLAQANDAAESDLPSSIPYAIFNGMRLKIDKAGRVVLPKPLRDRLGLHDGGDPDLHLHGATGGCREHEKVWGAPAAIDGRKPVCQERKTCSSVSFRTWTRTVRNG